MTLINTNDFQKEARTANSTYKKLAVQWLNEVLCRFGGPIRNRQIL